MEELSQNFEQIINLTTSCECKWESEVKDIQEKLKVILFGDGAPVVQNTSSVAFPSPQQLKKRVKRLSVVQDNEDEFDVPKRNSAKSLLTESLTVNETIPPAEPEKLQLPEQKQETEHVFARPVRAAKLKIENCLKEPSINSKLRRPDNFNDSTRKVKKEDEERPSQVGTKKLNKSTKSQVEPAESQLPTENDAAASSKKSDESIVVVAEKETPMVEIFSEEDDMSSTSSVVEKKRSKKDQSTKSAVVRVKKEKLSLEVTEEDSTSPPIAPSESTVSTTSTATTVVPLKPEPTASVEETLQTTTSTDSVANATRNKRGRKKKELNHRPIKEERVSIEPVAASPVSTRSSATKPRPASVYEDAVDNAIPEQTTQNQGGSTSRQNTPKSVQDETTTTSNATMVTAGDATFITNAANSTFAMPAPQTTFTMPNNANSTVTMSTNDMTQTQAGSLGDATFDVKDAPMDDSIMTDDDSFDKPLVPPKKMPAPASRPPVATKVLKTKSKPTELFNPCVQSPVKKKVEAFEHHAQVSSQDVRLKSTRSKKAKENTEPELPSIRELKASAATTPVIGKPHAPALGKFLTPTQQSNITPSIGNARKLPNSASKIMPFPLSKQASASNLKSCSSTSSQSLSRENSDEDLKKGFNKLQQLAEERKRKRELKHQQAALQREAKEKERADRLKKLMKEREEKNRKKALEMEQKKRELEEINRNLKLQEEREQHKQTAASSKAKHDANDAARQDRDMLEQMKAPKMKMPLPPKQQPSKYNFNMLHSDDSTDEEGKTSYKRPTPPLWSKSSVRADYICSQAYLSTAIIDSFFSVRPMTPDLKAIFPNIDPRYLKRNSSAIWQTPPRYSEMPKY